MEKKIKKNLGFTVIEILIVLAIIGILVAIFIAYALLRPGKDLDNSTEEVISKLRLAQSKTLTSEGPSQYGVYFDSTTTPNRYILFKGVSYAARDTSVDLIFKLPTRLEFYSISFSGGNEVVFKRVTGLAIQSGSVSLRFKDDPAQNKTVYVESSGRVGQSPSTPPDTRIKDSRHVHFDYSRVIDVNIEKLVLTFEGSVVQEIPILANLQGGQIEWEGEVSVNGAAQKIEIHTHRLNNPDTQFCVHRDQRYNNKSLVITISGDTTGNLIQYSADGSIVTSSSSYVSNRDWQ